MLFRSRLDVWLRLGGHRALRDDLRWLRAGSARARDLDVLARLVDKPARSAVRAARRAAQADLLMILDHPRTSGLIEALSHLPPIPVDAAVARAGRLVRDLRARGHQIDAPSADDAAYHSVRRALRRVRYAGELLGGPVGPLAAAQDAFGALGDATLIAGWRVDHPMLPEPELDTLRAGARQAWIELASALSELEDAWS